LTREKESTLKKYGTEKLDPDDTPTAIMSPITQALNNNNITLERLTSKLSDLIDCKRGEDPDNTTQLKAVETGLKLNQAYPDEKLNVDHTLKNFREIQINLVSPGKKASEDAPG